MQSKHVVVVGGSVAGLGTALALAQAGHRVTVLEQDATPLPATAVEAFEKWDRRGSPQTRHSHALLARLHNLIRDRAPEFLAELVANGAEPMPFSQFAEKLFDAPDLTPEDIDATCRLALGHPVGPFRLMDRISNTLVRDVQRILTDAYGARYETGAALDELIARGHTGRKAGRGWHRYKGVTS